LGNGFEIESNTIVWGFESNSVNTLYCINKGKQRI